MSTTYILNSPVRLHHDREHSTRLLFVNNALNPRDTLGKDGVNFHNMVASWFHKTIKAQVKVLDEHGQETTKTVRINRKSLGKYLGVDENHYTSEALVATLNHQCDEWATENSEKPAESGETKLRHAGEHNQRKIANWRTTVADSIAGKFFGWLYRKTTSSVTALKARFLFIHNERAYFKVSEQLATARFKETRKRVPAYRDHLGEFSENSETTLKDVPLTNKDNYIKPSATAKTNWRLHLDGRYPTAYKVDTSTGTTEAPTVWKRSHDEIKTVKKAMIVGGKMIMGKRPVLTINTFALGQYATGLSVHEIGRENGSVFSPGAQESYVFQELEDNYRYEQARLDEELWKFKTRHPQLAFFSAGVLETLINDVLIALLSDQKLTIAQAIRAKADDELYATLKPHLFAFSRLVKTLNAEKKQVMITGYPPFLLKLTAYAQQHQIDFKKYHVLGGAGGQAIGEPMRKRMVEAGFAQVLSSFGASDLDINIGLETEAEIELRRELEAHPQLAQELYGANKGVPMVFRYDPLANHIEVDPTNNHLVFTVNKDNRSSPRVRYDIKDCGRVYAASDMQAMLAKHGIFNPKIKTKHNLPFLFVWGRDSTAAFGTCNIPFDELDSSLQEIDTEHRILKCAFYSHGQDPNKTFDIWLELNDNQEFPDENEAAGFHAQLIEAMAHRNEYFKKELMNLPDERSLLPKIVFFKRGTSPIAEPGGQRKQVLVFTRKVEGIQGGNFDGHFERGDETRFESNLCKGQLDALNPARVLN